MLLYCLQPNCNDAGTIYANATPSPVSSLYAPFVSVGMPPQHTAVESEEEEETNDARSDDMVALETLAPGEAGTPEPTPAAAERVKSDGMLSYRHAYYSWLNFWALFRCIRTQAEAHA